MDAPFLDSDYQPIVQLYRKITLEITQAFWSKLTWDSDIKPVLITLQIYQQGPEINSF